MVSAVGFAGATDNASTVNVPWTQYGTADPIPIQAGDAAILAWNGQSVGWTAPTGWTLAGELNGDTGSQRSRIYIRALDGTEDSAPVPLTADTINKMMGILAVYRAVDVTDIIDAIASRDESTSGGSHANPAIMTVAADAPALAIIAERVSSGSTNFTAPSGYTKRIQPAPAGGGGSVSAALADDGLNVSRAAGSNVTPGPWANGVATDNIITWTISLTPATETGSGTGSITAGSTIAGTGAKGGTGTVSITGAATLSGTGEADLPPSGTGSITAAVGLLATGSKAGAGAGDSTGMAALTGTGRKTAAGTGAAAAATAMTGAGDGALLAPPTFPDGVLDVLVELQLAGTWTDVTEHVYLRDEISIAVGRADEGAGVDAGKMTLTFNNRDGRYSPRNPLSPYYGVLGRNTPIRVSVPVGPVGLQTPAAGTANASTPDAAALDITGDLDVRVEAAMAWRGHSGGIAGKYVETGNQRSWILWLNDDGTLTFYWSSNGGNLLSATSPAAVGTVRHQAVRATLDADNGASGRTITFYTSDTLDGTWTQLGAAVVQAGATSLFNSSSTLQAGEVIAAPINGRIYRMELRDGIGGTVIADPDFTVWAEGTTSFIDAAGNTWTVNGDAAITAREVRFTGEVSSWPTRWDTSGKDVHVPVEAAGIMRRLGQGRKPLKSALFRAVSAALLDPDPAHKVTAYWPMEDAGDAVQAAAAIPGVAPLAVRGPVTFVTEASGGTAGGAQFGDGARLVGATPSTGGPWMIVFWLDLPADMGTDGVSPIVQWRTPGSATATHWDLYTGQTINGVLFLECADDSNNIVISAGGSIDVRGRGPVQIAIEGFNAGSLLNVNVFVDGVHDFNAATPSADTVSTPTAIGVNLAVAAGTTFSGTVSHLLVTPWTSWHTAIFVPGLVAAGTGFRGETAGDRFVRLTGEEGIAAALDGDAADTEPMGPQLPAAVLELLRDAEAADSGTLHEARDALALRYRTRVSDYNTLPALTLDYLAEHIAPPLEPVDDDQYTKNDVTVTRTGGSSATLTDEAGPLSALPPKQGGVGRYDTSLALNLTDDSRLIAQAGWHLHLGTWDEARYRAVHIDLAAAPDLADALAAAGLRDMVRLTNLPDWLPPGDVDLFIEGYEEVIGQYDWDIVLHCRPAGPWRVGILDDEVLGRADTDGSQLDAAVTASATSLTVATTAGPIWTTDGDDVPFDVALGGEVVTVTVIAGTSTPQTFTVVRAVNGVSKAHDAGTDVRLAQPTIIAL